MALRANDADVKALVKVDQGFDTTPYLNMANLIVNEELVNSGLSTERLAMIEQFLAAHFLVLFVEKGGLTEEEMGDSKNSFANAVDSGFNSTRFGRQALVIDSSGSLTALSKKASGGQAQFRIV
ncbi:MAG: hypothetical protein ACC656_01120 [Candidatus Heimdallarchaeota archaeon]